jgi:SAM-dependent methyltransferase
MADNVLDVVTDYYGKVLQKTSDLKTSACCSMSAPPPALRKIMALLPIEVVERFYGCGNPIPNGIDGLTVVDLGSGSGRDCYIAAALVGEKGKVIGVDMTDEQLAVARAHADKYCTKTLGYSESNLDFRKGLIEQLTDSKGANIEKNSVDLVISNCVVNLSPRKDAVLQGVYDILKNGGEFYFSDVYSDRRLPKGAREHDVLVGECLGGALYTEDFRRLCQSIGFSDVRQLSCNEIEVNDPELRSVVGPAKFYSITYRLFKVEGIEDRCEDYGQVAKYKGTIPGAPFSYELDDHHEFVTGKPMLVCGNTALMCGSSWLASHFEVVGDFSTHYGLFDCSDGSGAASAVGAKPAGDAKGSCAPGTCC